MAVETFNESDLVGNKLQRLLKEVEDLASDGTKESYEKLEKFMVALHKVASDATLVVTKPDGRKYMTVKGTEFDITDALKDIVNTTETEINKNDAKQVEQQKAREALRKTISSTVGILLKEDEILQELASRGLTTEQFIKNAEAEIQKSQDKVTALKPLEDAKKANMDKFGKTIYSETAKSYMEKSTLDDLRMDKESVDLMAKVETKLTELKGLQDAAKTMAPDSQDYKNNKEAIEVLLGDVKGLAGDLKALDLHEGTPKATKIDFDYLEKLDINSDYDAAKTTLGTTQTKIATIIDTDYEAVRKVIRDNFAEFGFADEKTVDGLTHDEIDEAVEKARAELKSISDEIKFEENYQEELKASVEKYKAIAEREATLSGKIKAVKRKEPIMVPVVDKDGKPVLDKDGKQKQQPKMVEKKDSDGKPVLDKDGKPVLEPAYKEWTEYVPTDDARKEYLTAEGIDEVDYRKKEDDAARARAQAEEASLSNEEKREMIRAAYRKEKGFHPIKWIRSQFNPASMWVKDGYSSNYLADATTREVADAKSKVDTDLDARIASRFQKDLNDRNNAAEVTSMIRTEYKKNIISAVSQEKMTDELYRGTSEDVVKAGATRASATEAIRRVSDAEMYVAIKAKADGRMTETEYKAIEADYNAAVRSKMDARTSQDRAYASDVANPTKSRRPETPTFEDR